MTFWDNLTEVNNHTFTENGSEAYVSTGSYLVDFVPVIETHQRMISSNGCIYYMMKIL